MPCSLHPLKRASVIARAFCQDRTGANAVEFGLVAAPFLLLTIFVLQIGIYFMAKSALDSGVLIESENIRYQFNTGFAPNNPTTCAALQSAVVSNSFIHNDATLSVDIQPITNLTAGSVAVACVTPNYGNYGTPGDVLVLRAKYTPASFMPSFGPTLTLYSSALIRRQMQ